MALFGKNDKSAVPKEVKNSGSQSTTIITSCMVIKGDIKGCGTIHIDGTVHGDLNVEESVVIGKNGTVNGHVYAKNVTVSGKINGSVN
jgi:cytoskeletal protein CcmA (bactofilin family)